MPSSFPGQFGVDRDSLYGTLGDHERRVQALEAYTPTWRAGRFEILCTDPAVPVTVGSVELFPLFTPRDLVGASLVDCAAAVWVAAGSGTLEFDLWNLTQGVSFLTTLITIDATELTSFTAATPPVIGTAGQPLALGDQITGYCTDVADGTAQGIIIIMSFA